MITPINTFRAIFYPDLATANASNRLLGYGEVAFIIGDATRMKWGVGYRFSAKNPAAPTAQTFALTPWTYTDSASGRTPGTTFAVNVTAGITAANLAKKFITSTSAAAVAMTLPTATLLATQLGAVKGTRFEFDIDNTTGANILTVTVAAGIVAATPALTGGASLAVAAGSFGRFMIVFSSPTAAIIFRTV